MVPPLLTGAAFVNDGTARPFRKSPTLRELPPPPAGRTGWPWTEQGPASSFTVPRGHNWPSLSIVTPSFNQAAFLEETIRSVLLQGYPNLQYIIVDGGSPDGSVEVITRYQPWLSWWVSEPDGGQTEAVNKGFRQAQGDIVAWINSDDTYPRDALAQALTFFADNPSCDLVYGNCTMVDEEGRTMWVWFPGEFDAKHHLCDGNAIPQPTVFFRRSVLERAGLLNEQLHYAFDYEFWLRALLVARVCYLPRSLANFRYHAASKTVSETGAFRRETEAILEEFFSRPDLPAEVRGFRKRALAGFFLRNAREWLKEGNRTECQRNFRKAFRLAPVSASTSRYLLFFLLGLLRNSFCARHSLRGRTMAALCGWR